MARRQDGARLGAIALAAAAVLTLGRPHAPAPAQGKPFGLPFAEPPGPATWYVSQPYGNSLYAFYERGTIYRSGQGLHMGLDFAAACGTTVVAVGDGVVRSVDGPGGAPPHNLAIEHDGGLVSFYGHLLERPDLVPGQPVVRGQPVALSGDMYETCAAAPHLHLEIRDASMARAFNPVDFVAADWNRLLLLGASPLDYVRDLDAPRRWQALDDQPPIQFGGPMLNDYARSWPAVGN